MAVKTSKQDENVTKEKVLTYNKANTEEARQPKGIILRQNLETSVLTSNINYLKECVPTNQ
jgi:hypothetical protein